VRCGAKRFLVEVEMDNEKQKKTIVARTPAEARKKIRLQCGENIEVVSVKEK